MAKLLAKALRAGETIGLIAPASPPRSPERVEKAVSYLERQGYRVEVGKHLYDATESPADERSSDLGYLAATDEARVADIHAMFANPDIKAIMALRGGYGTIRLLDRLDYDLIKKHPKIMVGYSDMTALFHAIYRVTGLSSCFFGPMPSVDMWDTFDPFAEECFWRAITSTTPLGALPLGAKEGQIVRRTEEASVMGKLLPMNITVFCSLLGTPYQPRFKDTIPLIEEIDEKPRKIDAYFAQLRHAGLWREANAILVGYLSGCDEDKDAPTRSLPNVMNDYFGDLGIPVVHNLPFGHEPRMWTVPVGARCRVTTSGEQGKVEIVERVLS